MTQLHKQEMFINADFSVFGTKVQLSGLGVTANQRDHQATEKCLVAVRNQVSSLMISKIQRKSGSTELLCSDVNIEQA